MPYHIGIKLKWVKYLSLIGIAACILAFLTGILVMITRLPYLKLLLLLLCLIGGKLSFFSNITSEFWAGTKFTVNSLHSSLLLLLGDYGVWTKRIWCNDSEITCGSELQNHGIAQLFSSSGGDLHWAYEISQGQPGWELINLHSILSVFRTKSYKSWNQLWLPQRTSWSEISCWLSSLQEQIVDCKDWKNSSM